MDSAVGGLEWLPGSWSPLPHVPFSFLPWTLTPRTSHRAREGCLAVCVPQGEGVALGHLCSLPACTGQLCAFLEALEMTGAFHRQQETAQEPCKQLRPRWRTAACDYGLCLSLCVCTPDPPRFLGTVQGVPTGGPHQAGASHGAQP